MTPHDLLTALNTAPFELFGAPTTWAELLGFVTGLLAVGLAARAHVLTWPIGIANALFFAVLFADARLYADMALQGVYVGLGVFGWWAWLRLGGRGGERKELEVREGDRRLLALTAFGVLAATALFIPILGAVRGGAPVFDGLTTAMSLGAQLLLCLKVRQSWIWWIAVDVIYVPLYLERGLVLTAIVYVLFLLMCIGALRDWGRIADAQREQREAQEPRGPVGPAEPRLVPA